METYIHETSRIIQTNFSNIKLYRNSVVSHSEIAPNCSIGDDTVIERCKIENNVTINRRSYINDSVIGKYTYMGINTTMNFTKIGRFCSLARNVDIGGFDHDYTKITTMPSFRFNQTLNGGGKLQKKPQHSELCTIGNDVWIAAGAQVLHDVTIGNGAVVGGGAVVTKDVPPYAIVAGVPAKIIKYRFHQKYIDFLEKIQWWNWPEDLLKTEMPFFISKDMNDEAVNYLQCIWEKIMNTDSVLR